MGAEARLSSPLEAAKLASMAEVAFCPPGDANSAVERSPNEIETTPPGSTPENPTATRSWTGPLSHTYTHSRAPPD